MDEKLPEDWIAEAENDIRILRYEHGRASKFIEALKLYEKMGRKDKVEEMRWDVLLFNLRQVMYSKERKESGQRFAPIAIINGVPNVDPNNIPDAALDYYERRAGETKNPIHLARYCDMIWEKRRKHEFARKAIDAYLECVSLYIKNDWYIEMVDSLQRATELALKLNDTSKISEVKAKIFDTMEVLSNEKKYRWCLELIDAIFEMENWVNEKELQRTIEIAKNGEQYYASEVADGYHIQRSFLKQLIELFKIVGREGEAHSCCIKIAESYEREAEFKSFSMLVAAHFYEEAMREYISLGITTKVDEMKLKIKECYKKGENEFKTIETPFMIPSELIAKEVAKFIKPSIEESLESITKEEALLPNIARIRMETAKQKKEFAAYSIIPRTHIRGNRTVSGAKTQEEIFDDLLISNIQLHYQMNAVLVGKIIEQLKAEKGLDHKQLINYLAKSTNFNKENLEIIATGIERYFSGDYVSAIHVIVPQLEDVLRGILGKIGRPTTSTQAGIMREKPLDVVLEDEEIKSVFGENLLYYLKIFLIDQRGENLRHDVAHGLIRSDRCTKRNMEILIHQLIVLTKLKFSSDKSKEEKA